jgi:HNH endonuclease
MTAARLSKALRARVSTQARHRCGYCLTAEAIVGTPMEIDHIIPRALAGPTDEDNLWLACSLCNDHKGDQIAATDPLTGELVRLFDPRHQVWDAHFAWTVSAACTSRYRHPGARDASLAMGAALIGNELLGHHDRDDASQPRMDAPACCAVF